MANPSATRVAEEVCTDEAGLRAIAKFKKSKAVGVDKFDGYIVRIAPEPVKMYYMAMELPVRDRNDGRQRERGAGAQ